MALNLSDRNELPNFLSGVGVEIGVFLGEYSHRLLRDSRLSLLVSVDLWQQDGGYYPTQEVADQVFDRCKSLLSDFSSRSLVLRMSGQQASLGFHGNSLDFIYIDSSHGYQETLEQLTLWYPKMKRRSIMAGHDYANGPEVQQAVGEFAAAHRLTIETTTRDMEFIAYGQVNSWLILLP